MINNINDAAFAEKLVTTIELVLLPYAFAGVYWPQNWRRQRCLASHAETLWLECLVLVEVNGVGINTEFCRRSNIFRDQALML